MPIDFNCPSCGRTLRVPDGSAGREARCPSCNTIAQVPEAGAPSAGGGNPFAGPGSGNPFGEGGPGAPVSGAPMSAVNPYAAPPPPTYTPVSGSGVKGELQPRRVDIGETIGQAWQILTQNFVACLLVGLVLTGLNLGLNLTTQAIDRGAKESHDPAIVIVVTLATGLLSQVIQTYLQLGIIKFGLSLARTGRGAVGDVFSGGPYFLRGLGVTIIVVLAVLGILIAAALPPLVVLGVQGGPDAVSKNPVPIVVTVVVCVLLLVVAITWLTLRWFLAFSFIVDRDAGALEALAQSAKYMHGNKVTVFVIQILVGLLVLIGVIITCCLGSVLVVPYMGILYAVLYLSATGQPYGTAMMSSPNVSRPA